METVDAPLGLTLWTTDIDGLALFLERVTGMQLEARHPGFAELRCGEALVMLHADESYRGHPWYNALQQEGAVRGIGAELRVRVPSVDDAYRQAARLGALVVQPPYSPQEGLVEFHVLAPDGYLVTPWEST